MRCTFYSLRTICSFTKNDRFECFGEGSHYLCETRNRKSSRRILLAKSKELIPAINLFCQNSIWFTFCFKFPKCLTWTDCSFFSHVPLKFKLWRFPTLEREESDSKFARVCSLRRSRSAASCFKFMSEYGHPKALVCGKRKAQLLDYHDKSAYVVIRTDIDLIFKNERLPSFTWINAGGFLPRCLLEEESLQFEAIQQSIIGTSISTCGRHL